MLETDQISQLRCNPHETRIRGYFAKAQLKVMAPPCKHAFLRFVLDVDFPHNTC